tara:strand:- start:42 stop:248 length:207 start_codon:yes stop_codon:yes gene_type:complete
MSHIVSKYGKENYISNRMAIPSYDIVDFSYDSADNITTVIYSRDGAGVAQLNYNYDSADNVIKIQRIS